MPAVFQQLENKPCMVLFSPQEKPCRTWHDGLAATGRRVGKQFRTVWCPFARTLDKERGAWVVVTKGIMPTGRMKSPSSIMSLGRVDGWVPFWPAAVKQDCTRYDLKDAKDSALAIARFNEMSAWTDEERTKKLRAMREEAIALHRKALEDDYERDRAAAMEMAGQLAASVQESSGTVQDDSAMKMMDRKIEQRHAIFDAQAVADVDQTPEAAHHADAVAGAVMSGIV